MVHYFHRLVKIEKNYILIASFDHKLRSPSIERKLRNTGLSEIETIGFILRQKYITVSFPQWYNSE